MEKSNINKMCSFNKTTSTKCALLTKPQMFTCIVLNQSQLANHQPIICRFVRVNALHLYAITLSVSTVHTLTTRLSLVLGVKLG